jgi:hypothetical protein
MAAIKYVLQETTGQRAKIDDPVLQLCQWGRGNASDLVDTSFIPVCGFNTNSTQCFLQLKSFQIDEPVSNSKQFVRHNNIR